METNMPLGEHHVMIKAEEPKDGQQATRVTLAASEETDAVHTLVWDFQPPGLLD